MSDGVFLYVLAGICIAALVASCCGWRRLRAIGRGILVAILSWATLGSVVFELDVRAGGVAVLIWALLGVWVGLREWRLGKDELKPPRLIFDTLGYGAIFTGVLWSIVAGAYPYAYYDGRRPSWLLAGVVAVSCVPGYLAARLGRWAYNAKQARLVGYGSRGSANTDGPCEKQPGVRRRA